MTKCCINITPLNVPRETLHIRMILINIKGATYIYIFTNVNNKINYKYNLIYVVNNAISNND